MPITFDNKLTEYTYEILQNILGVGAGSLNTYSYYTAIPAPVYDIFEYSDGNASGFRQSSPYVDNNTGDLDVTAFQGEMTMFLKQLFGTAILADVTVTVARVGSVWWVYLTFRAASTFDKTKVNLTIETGSIPSQSYYFSDFS